MSGPILMAVDAMEATLAELMRELEHTRDRAADAVTVATLLKEQMRRLKELHLGSRERYARAVERTSPEAAAIIRALA